MHLLPNASLPADLTGWDPNFLRQIRDRAIARRLDAIDAAGDLSGNSPDDEEEE